MSNDISDAISSEWSSVFKSESETGERAQSLVMTPSK